MRSFASCCAPGGRRQTGADGSRCSRARRAWVSPVSSASCASGSGASAHRAVASVCARVRREPTVPARLATAAIGGHHPGGRVRRTVCQTRGLGDHLLAGIEDPCEAAALLANLLGVDAPEQHSRLKLMPQQLRRIFDVLLALVQGLSRRQLVVAVYEDLQWADRSTPEFRDRLIHRVAGLPVLVVMTFRPEFERRGMAAPVPCPSHSLRSSAFPAGQ